MSSESDSVRVAIVQRVLASYRRPVFNRVARLDGVELTVIHGTNPKGLARGNASVDETAAFDNIKLPTIAVGIAGFHFVWLRGLLTMARRDRYDVYICPGAPTMLSVMALFLYTRLQGTATLVWWGRNLRPKRDAGRVGQLLRDLTKYVRGPLYRSASCCLCYGTAAAGYFQSFGAPESDTFIAYNSTDTTRQREVERCCRNDPSLLDAIRDEYDLIGRTIITFAGTLTDEKNVDNLIDIQRKLLGEGYDTSLVVAGDGPELGRLRDYASDVDHVHFTGWLKTDRLARVLLVTDLFVMPGHGGLAVQEAMALRNPVVTVPLDGTERDLIQQGKNGYVVGHGSTDTLYSAVTAVLNEPESVRDEMGLRSREIIDNRVNIDRMVDGFRQAIETASNENTVTRDIPVA